MKAKARHSFSVLGISVTVDSVPNLRSRSNDVLKGWIHDVSLNLDPNGDIKFVLNIKELEELFEGIKNYLQANFKVTQEEDVTHETS